MALAAYATEHGGITMLNSHQLEIVRKVILVLKPTHGLFQRIQLVFQL